MWSAEGAGQGSETQKVSKVGDCRLAGFCDRVSIAIALAAPPTHMLTLAQLPIGPYATVVSMPTGRAALTRLREMGIVPGSRLKVTRRAPLGEPIEICVRGSRLSMRNHEAAFIEVEADAAAGCVGA